MTRWLSFLLVLLTASAFAYAPVPKAMLSRTEMELRPGTRTLVATAQHSSKLFTTNSTVTFTNNALDQTTVNHFAEGQLSYRVWKNSLGETNRVQFFTWDGRSRLIATTELDANNNGYNWSAVYDGLGRRLSTTTIIVTNGVALTSQPKLISQCFDPSVEFLELGVTVGGKQRWKVYGPDLDGRYGGLNGKGGFDGIVDDVGVVRPLVSDARGDVLGVFDTVDLAMKWNTSRPTGYGAVPEFRPLSLAEDGDLAAACARGGRWPDRSGLYWLGGRYYDPVAGRFISCDPYGHDADASLYAYCDGDPINRDDSDGRVGKATASWAGGMATGLAGLVNNTLGTLAYTLASPFAPDWAYQNLGGYAQGFGNTMMGLGQTTYDAGAFATYGVTSPFAPEWAYNNYGGSMERLGGVADALRGGSDQSLAYQITYGTLNAGTLFLGGELGQLGRVGRVGRVGEAAGASTQVARVGEYANWGGEFSYLDEVGFGAVRPNATRTATQLEFDFVNNLPPKPPINWPDNWGFAGNPSPATLVPGTLVDRWGLASGNFVSPEGTPFIQRSLAPGTQYAPYNVYQVLQPIDVNAGQIAPAFGMPGNGMQFQLPSPVQSLIDSGHLGTR